MLEESVDSGSRLQLRAQRIQEMFSKQSTSPSSEAQTPTVPDAVWSERFRDVSRATLTPITSEGKGATLLLQLELTESGKVSTHSAENEVRTILSVPVEERDAPALLRMLGKRVLLREKRLRTSLEKEALEHQVNALQLQLSAALEREEALRSNLHTLVEGTRRLP
jgi:hypothetical protein